MFSFFSCSFPFYSLFFQIPLVNYHHPSCSKTQGGSFLMFILQLGWWPHHKNSQEMSFFPFFLCFFTIQILFTKTTTFNVMSSAVMTPGTDTGPKQCVCRSTTITGPETHVPVMCFEPRIFPFTLV